MKPKNLFNADSPQKGAGVIISIAVIAAVVIIDQITKIIVSMNLAPDKSFNLIDGVFRFSYVENRGAAFGMLDNHRWVFLSLSTVAIVGICYFLFKYRPQNKLMNVALSLVVGGGIGNMIDRVRLGYVIDFFDFYAFPNLWRWVFNVADASVCVAAGIIIVYLIMDMIHEKRRAVATHAEQSEL